MCEYTKNLACVCDRRKLKQSITVHLQVVNYMHRCMKTENLDHSLIRHFISEVGIIIIIIIINYNIIY